MILDKIHVVQKFEGSWARSGHLVVPQIITTVMHRCCEAGLGIDHNYNGLYRVSAIDVHRNGRVDRPAALCSGGFAAHTS
jgi:hypothetical protein